MSENQTLRSRKPRSGYQGSLQAGKDPGSARHGAPAGDAEKDFSPEPYASRFSPVADRLQRSSGKGRVMFKILTDSNGTRTVLGDLDQSGCVRIRLPRSEPRVSPSAVIINTSGGLTDGDEIALAATWETGTLAAITSQAAERIYRARPALTEIGPAHIDTARIETSLTVGAGATGLWLPQETILFDGGRYRRRITADIAEGGTLLACESLIVGRRAMGERVTSAFVHDGWRVRYGGRLVLADALRLEGDLEALLDRPAVGRGARAIATVLLVGPLAEACLEPARASMAETGGLAGAGLVGPVLIARLLAADGARLRRDLTALLECLLKAMGGANPGGHLALPRLWHF